MIFKFLSNIYRGAFSKCFNHPQINHLTCIFPPFRSYFIFIHWVVWVITWKKFTQYFFFILQNFSVFLFIFKFSLNTEEFQWPQLQQNYLPPPPLILKIYNRTWNVDELSFIFTFNTWVCPWFPPSNLLRFSFLKQNFPWHCYCLLSYLPT